MKDERQPRAKKAKTHAERNKNNKTTNDAIPDHSTEAESVSQVLEDFAEGASGFSGHKPVLQDLSQTLVHQDYPNTYWCHAHDSSKQAEMQNLIREIAEAMPEPSVMRALYEVFVIRCQGPLGNVIYTPAFMAQVEDLSSCLACDSLQEQVHAVSTTFSMDTLACHLLALVLGLAFHPTPSLLEWSPTPVNLRVEELRVSSTAYSNTWRSLALRCIRGDITLFCGSIAALQAAVMLLLDGQGLPTVQEAILVTAIFGAQKLGLHRLGKADLQADASPSYVSGDKQSIKGELPHVRTEIGLRIWWALVVRDWARGQIMGYYSIHPSHFTTRIPLHLNDDDLCLPMSNVASGGNIIERHRSEFTMLSYTIHSIEIASLAREFVDLNRTLSHTLGQGQNVEIARMQRHFNSRYEKFITGLPYHFRLGSTAGNASRDFAAAIPPHRWMLHQQLWSLFLKLYRIDLASQNSQATCQLLAQNIISTQAQIQVRCAVCGTLSTSEMQLFSAAVTLLIDLLFSPKYEKTDDSSSQLCRLMTRDKIQEAIELLREHLQTSKQSTRPSLSFDRVNQSPQRKIIALEALTELEDQKSQDREKGNNLSSNGAGANCQRINSTAISGSSIKNKITEILRSLEEDGKLEDEGIIPSSSPSASALDQSLRSSNEAQDLNVFPMLSDDPSYDLWQFLDFSAPFQNPSENDTFPASEDIQEHAGMES
ncbi:hypothetical protein ACLMJK_005607 [Lecanora helva]